VLVPTVMLGRSPAKGAQGQVTSPELFARILADVEADALFGLVDLVITGHFSLPEQVEIAAGVLGRVRDASERRPVIVVDPIMGDTPKGLYVKPEVARAVADHLVPLGDWLTPNLWELSWLTGGDITDTRRAIDAAQSLGKPVLLTSAPTPEDESGIMYIDSDGATLFAHPRHPQAPNGTGDLVAACFGAALIEGLAPLAAAERAARAASEAVTAAQDLRAPALPIVALGERLVHPTARLRIERLTIPA
jgi:pyridoxine kinase